MRYFSIVILVIVLLVCCSFFIPNQFILAQVPKVHPEIQQDQDGRYYISTPLGGKMYQQNYPPLYTFEQMTEKIVGTSTGIDFDFTPQPVLNLGLEYKKNLDANQVKEIRAAFRQNGYNLSHRLIITKLDQGWQLADQEYKFNMNIVEKANSLEVSVRLDGSLYYGFIKPGDGKYPYPLYLGNPSPIINNKASIDLTRTLGKLNFIDWDKTGFGIIGYRVMRDDGLILYDGKISFRGKGPFQIGTSIIVGPFVNCITHNSAIISFDTNVPVKPSLKIADVGAIFHDQATTHHEITVTNLQPDQTYTYTVQVDDYSETYSFKTAPTPGSRKPFTFAYASDCRAGYGGGERNIFGVNAYVFKKVMTAIADRKVTFFQFTGDLADGYKTNTASTWIEYQNWKRTIEPVAHYLPIYVGIGNHEALIHRFDDQSSYGIQVDKFPYQTDSAEAYFARVAVNPTNGPTSEDGAVYDPDPNSTDFPPYQENVFYYTYDNVGMIVLNSDYWFNPSQKKKFVASGNFHGYIMEQQMRWLEETLKKMEQDQNIDVVFVTMHTPALPNGGHKKDSMWYNGDNGVRAIVAGKPVDKGIIECRDELLTLLMKSSKVVALLAGDEHNYNRFLLTNKANIYPPDWKGEKITEAPYFRNLWQITNGGAGAPYASQEELPWSDHVQYFTVQYSMVLFHIHGKNVRMEVINPDTLDVLDQAQLRE